MKNLQITKIIPAATYFLLGGVVAANLLMSYPAQAQTETIAESMAAHNAAACASVSLPANCKDVDIAAALPDVVRGVEQTVYSTVTSYRDAVIVPPRLREKLEQRRNRVIERLVQMVVERPAKCVIILTAAELPTDVCK